MSSLKLFPDVSNAKACASIFPKTVAQIGSLVEDVTKLTAESLDTICSVQADQRTFANTPHAADIAGAQLSAASAVLEVVEQTAADKETRDVARDKLVELESLTIEQLTNNKKLYAAMKEYQETPEWKEERDDGIKDKTGQLRYWVNEEMADYKRLGLEMEGDAFDEVVALQKRIASLSTTFSSNVAEDSTELYLTREELAGTPEQVLQVLAPHGSDDNKLVVKLDYPTYFGILRNCEVAATRRTLSEAFANRAFPANIDVLRDLIHTRHQLATKLGYESFAAYNLDGKMIKSPENAAQFIRDLIPGLQRKWQEEKELLLKHLHPSVELTPEGDIHTYDFPFCVNQVKRSVLNVDETKIREYFPLDATVQALFDIYQSFFGLTFKRHENGADLWDPSTSTLEVIDNESNTLLGHIIVDLFPRAGKYTHACCHGVVPAVEQDEATKSFSPAVSVVVANFPKSADAATPSLFLHSDVETFFHEFGHALHNLLGRARMSTAAGTSVKRDFVELPSQMLEEWLWDKAILQKVSRHYKTGQPLPDDLIDAKIASKNAFSGRDTLRQLQLATYSLEIFSTPFSAEPVKDRINTTRLWHEIQPRIMGGQRYSDRDHFECAFGHLTGYGAGYYGYMYSKVLALDVFEYIHSREGLLDPSMGRRYSDAILAWGGGRDPNVSVREFLNREPSPDAFLASLGIKK